MARPVIGYTKGNKKLDVLSWAIYLSIRLSGGKPVALSAKDPRYDLEIDGLIIAGGTDISPRHYRQKEKTGYQYDLPRDEMELRWLHHAHKYDLPVMGICRGAQLMNIDRGGSLHKDIGKIYEKAKYPAGILANMFFRKTILIREDTLLFKILPFERLWVNSMHTQSVAQRGKGLIECAREKNGVIQAIEDPDMDFYLGVQFHPELLIYQRRFRALFKALIQAARI